MPPVAQAFFPDHLFGWCFYGGLVTILILASYFDLKSMIVPKTITIGSLALGLIANVVRGAWLGSNQQTVWLFSEPGPVLGGLDGLLFALVGFLAAFGIFFVMWILGTCGGGDVKLFAGLGAWLGAYWSLLVLLGTYAVVLVLLVVLSGLRLLPKRMQPSAKTRSSAAEERGSSVPTKTKPAGLKIAYSFPAALSVALVLLWVWGPELGIRVRSEKANAALQGKAR